MKKAVVGWLPALMCVVCAAFAVGAGEAGLSVAASSRKAVPEARAVLLKKGFHRKGAGRSFLHRWFSDLPRAPVEWTSGVRSAD